MSTRNLTKNQDITQKALDKNKKNATKSIAKDYSLALDLIRAEILKVIERNRKIDLETMSKFNRKDKLYKSINDILNSLFSSVIRKTRRLVDATYKQAYFRNAWAVDMAIGVNMKWRLKK